MPIKLLDRIIEMSSKEQYLIFDPFGGAGTTYIVSEIKNRKWLGVELGPVKDSVNRFQELDKEIKLLNKYRDNYNALFLEKLKKERIKRNLWTDDSFKENGQTENGRKKDLQQKLF